MPTRFNMAINDYDDEVGTFGFAVVDITAANYDAQSTLQSSFRAAAVGLMTGETRKYGISQDSATLLDLPTDPTAQREIKYLVTMRDAVASKFFNFELPTADMQLLPTNDSYLVKRGAIQGADTGGEIAAFITAAEAYYVSPYGNAATVWEIELVGRNN